MLRVEAQSIPVPTDIIDGGNSASPPADIYDSMFQMVAQRVTGVLTPVYSTVSSAEAIAPARAQFLYVKVGATSTTVTVQVPGQQPYSGADRNDEIVSGVSNTERAFFLPRVILTDPTDSIVVSYSPFSAVTAALIQVG